jgi:hypothetical protein
MRGYQRQMQSLLSALPPPRQTASLVKYYFALTPNAGCFLCFHRPRQDCIDRQIILFCSQRQMQISSGAWCCQTRKVLKALPLFPLVPGAAGTLPAKALPLVPLVAWCGGQRRHESLKALPLLSSGAWCSGTALPGPGKLNLKRSAISTPVPGAKRRQPLQTGKRSTSASSSGVHTWCSGTVLQTASLKHFRWFWLPGQRGQRCRPVALKHFRWFLWLPGAAGTALQILTEALPLVPLVPGAADGSFTGR